MRKKYTFIDLFAGCGGLSEGFMQSGHFKSLAHVEWELPMVNTLRNRLVKEWGYSEDEAKRNVVLFDIQKTDELLHGKWSKESVAKYAKENDPMLVKHGLKKLVGRKKVDLIIGGPPCQAYSIHGRAQDKDGMNNDYRNYLFESFARVVTAFRPELFVFENVTGILSAHPGGVKITQRIYEAFDKIGYEIKSPADLENCVFNAYDFGVPQDRKRVILIGIRKGGRIQLDEVYKAIQSQQSQQHISVRDAIGNFPALYPLKEPKVIGRIRVSHSANTDNHFLQHDARNHSPREMRVFADWTGNDLNRLSQKEKIAYYYKITGHKTLYAKYRSLEWDKPSYTIVAHLSKDGYMFIHPDPKQARSITIREAATLMSFPLDYEFLGSTPYCYKMIGNAVPVLFAKGIANGIYKTMKR